VEGFFEYGGALWFHEMLGNFSAAEQAVVSRQFILF
jgi:hypothetical protein